MDRVRDDFTEPFIRLTHKPIKEAYFEDKVTERAKNKFSYKIAAIDTSYNMSELTEPISAYLPDVTAPEAPVIIGANSDSISINLEWLSVLTETDDLAGYRLLRRIDGQDENSETTIAETLAKNAVSFTDKELKAGGTYSYRLQAYDETGNISEFSNAYTIRVKPKSMTAEAMDKFNVNFQKKKNRTVLKWKNEESRAAKGSVVFRKKSNGRMLAYTPLLSDVLIYIDEEIQSGETYIYQVKTYYEDGEIDVSDTQTIVVE